jgi:homoserine kinase type II
MTLSRGRISRDEARKALGHWDVDVRSLRVRAAGGTANANLRLSACGRELFLRRRSERYSSEEQVRFDHALMEHLAGCGLCTPVALLTRDGRRWARWDGRVYELYPFVEGDEHDPTSLAEILSAARRLRAFHDATREWREPPGKAWPRRNDPKEALAALQGVLQLARSRDERAGLDRLIERARRLGKDFPDEAYWALPTVVIHGDYHPANLKFRGGEVVGIFDLDWATRQPRMVDIADGLIFFAGVRASPTDPADIFSLTQTFEFDPPRMRAFLRAYGAEVLTQDEANRLRDFLLARWIYCRADAMRKVPDEEKLRLLLTGVEEPLEWLERYRVFG